MTSRTIFVTGASRGIGLELVRRLHEAGHRVIASCRNPERATELAAIGVPVVALDVADLASTRAAPDAIVEHTDQLDVLVNNAAINHVDHLPRPCSMGPLAELDPLAVEAVLRTNVVGTLAVTQAVLPLLRRPGGVIVNMSSNLSSYERSVGVDYSYNPSKTALNMVTVIMQRDLGPSGLTAVAVNPGWIRTAMGGPDAPLDLGEATADLAALIGRLDAGAGGRFIGRHGEPMPW